jgi:hypothetical protein
VEHLVSNGLAVLLHAATKAVFKKKTVNPAPGKDIEFIKACEAFRI